MNGCARVLRLLLALASVAARWTSSTWRERVAICIGSRYISYAVLSSVFVSGGLQCGSVAVSVSGWLVRFLAGAC